MDEGSFVCAKAQGKRKCLHFHLPPHANWRNSQGVFLEVMRKHRARGKIKSGKERE